MGKIESQGGPKATRGAHCHQEERHACGLRKGGRRIRGGQEVNKTGAQDVIFPLQASKLSEDLGCIKAFFSHFLGLGTIFDGAALEMMDFCCFVSSLSCVNCEIKNITNPKKKKKKKKKS